MTWQLIITTSNLNNAADNVGKFHIFNKSQPELSFVVVLILTFNAYQKPKYFYFYQKATYRLEQYEKSHHLAKFVLICRINYIELAFLSGKI